MELATSIHNTANFFGGAISAQYNVELSLTGDSNFINNSAAEGGVFFAFNNISVSFMGTSNFINNSASLDGGGAFLSRASSFFILPNTTVYWENNRASFGGAIYVVDQSPLHLLH